MKYLYKLKKIEYKEGADACLSNAKVHVEAAVLCANNGLNGIAHSHLVMSCEELCKASILKIKTLSPTTTISDFRLYFADHRIKHQRVWQIFISLIPSREIEKNNNANLAPMQNPLNGTAIVGAALTGILMAIIILLDQGVDSEMTQEEVRVRGLYVDLTDAKVWQVPNEIFTSKMFQKNLLITQHLFEHIEEHLFNITPTKLDLKNLLTGLGYIKNELNGE